MSQTVAEQVMPVISVLKDIPKHDNVVNYTGARFCNGGNLVALTEPFPLTIPPHLTDCIMPIKQECTPLNLRDLLRHSVEGGVSFLDQVLPMPLRENILRDVAKGLNHLHTQHPPLVHGDLLLENGNVVISSLDVSGPGPWAKIAHLGQLSQSDAKQRNNNNFFPGPEPRGYPKADVWNFGSLVHQVVDPLASLVELEFPLPPIVVATALSTATAVNQSTRIKVDRAAVYSTTVARGQFTPIFNTSGGIPEWAKQVITCCWEVDTPKRPSMRRLLYAWDLCSNTH
ncbi:hypothetical protein Pelo_15436 [Pelomyxa schiedti]|nr:hypothetical protein Pelo_15436 [Pelomyxa schiedti]